MNIFQMNNAVEATKKKLDVYAIYLRKSRADLDAEKHGEGETLARHKKILMDLAERKGYYIGEVYEEIVSGETIEARPEVQRLITDCYAGKYKGILIVEVTRLSRGNQGDAQKIMDCLKYSNRNNGVQVITPTKIYDVAHSQEDEEYIEFELFMSRREYKMIQKRMDRGRKQAVVEGNYMGSYRPYGYNIKKTRTMRTLTPNEDEAPYVKKMFEWRIKENLTTYKIAQRLTAMGVPTYRGERIWNKETVRAILTNPVYVGKVRWNDRMQIKTMVNGELKTSRPRSSHGDQFMLYEGKHVKDALVDEETFTAANVKFVSDKTKGNKELVNPLASLLRCAKCGKVLGLQMYGNKKGRVKPRYYHPDAVYCNVKSAVMEDVQNAVIHAIKMYIEDFEVQVDQMPDTDEDSILSEIEEMKKEIKRIEQKIENLLDNLEDRVISSNDFVKRKTMHESRIEAIQEQIEILKISMPEKVEYEEKIYMLHDALDAMLDHNIAASIKNDFLKRIFDKIEFSRENGVEFILDITLK